MAPLFEKYLLIFQSEGPLVHRLFPEMKDLLAVIMKRFLNPTLTDGKLAKDLVAIDVSDPENQLLLKRMDFGHEAMSHVTVDKIQICVCRWFV